MKQIRHDFATHDFKAWLAQLILRVEQMPLLTLYFEKGDSPREAARDGVGYEAAQSQACRKPIGQARKLKRGLREGASIGG